MLKRARCTTPKRRANTVASFTERTSDVMLARREIAGKAVCSCRSATQPDDGAPRRREETDRYIRTGA
jgi:hypothetical protein